MKNLALSGILYLSLLGSISGCATTQIQAKSAKKQEQVKILDVTPGLPKDSGDVIEISKDLEKRLDDTNSVLLQYFTYDAQAAIESSHLYAARLKSTSLLKTSIPPVGMYFRHTNVRAIDQRVLDSQFLETVMFHEMVHCALNYCEIDRESFLEIYDAMDPEEWDIKKTVEERIKSYKPSHCADLVWCADSDHYVSAHPDFSDFHCKEYTCSNAEHYQVSIGEIITFTAEYWKRGGKPIPTKMEQIFSTILNTDLIADLNKEY